MNTKLIIAFVLAGAGVLSGCARSNSTRTDIGGGITLPSLSPNDDRAERVPQDSPSTNALSRQNWRPVVIAAPVYGIAAQDTYSGDWRLASTTHRQRGGEFPTAATSLEEFGGTTWSQRAEAAASPFLYVGEVVMMPVRMVMTPQWSEVPASREQFGRSSMFTAKKPIAKTQPKPEPKAEQPAPSAPPAKSEAEGTK